MNDTIHELETKEGVINMLFDRLDIKNEQIKTLLAKIEDLQREVYFLKNDLINNLGNK